MITDTLIYALSLILAGFFAGVVVTVAAVVLAQRRSIR